MSVTLTDVIGMTVQEVPPNNTTLVSTNNPVQFDALNCSQTLTSTSTPPCTKQISYQVALSAGAYTIDLTAAAGGANGATVNGNGLKVVSYLFDNPATNANSITIATGASNGYALFGASGQITLTPGERVKFQVKLGNNSGRPTIGSSAKTIDLTGTGSQVLNVQIGMG